MRIATTWRRTAHRIPIKHWQEQGFALFIEALAFRFDCAMASLAALRAGLRRLFDLLAEQLPQHLQLASFSRG